MHYDFSAHNQTAYFPQKWQKGMRSNFFAELANLNFPMLNFLDSKRKPLKPEDFRGFGAASQI